MRFAFTFHMKGICSLLHFKDRCYTVIKMEMHYSIQSSNHQPQISQCNCFQQKKNLLIKNVKQGLHALYNI